MTDERQPPLHPLAALAIIALDGISGTIEILDPFVLVVSCVGVGLLGFASTTLVQRHLANEGWGAAIAKGLVMGILAGVPYPVLGTAIGTPLLIWAGVHRWITPSEDKRPLLDDPENRS